MPKRKIVPAKKATTNNMNNAFNNDGVEIPRQPQAKVKKAVTPNKAPKTTKPKAKDTKRRAGKSSNPDFSKLTLYVKTDTVTEVKKQLLGTSQDASELAEKLFSDWLKKKN